MTSLENRGPRQGRQPPFIVLAEDDDDIRYALVNWLERDGFRVAAAPDGSALIELLGACEQAHDLPDVIVTDHRMPGYTGVDVLDGLNAAGWKTPVIVVTAFGNEVRAAAEARGACSVFDKPFDLDALGSTIRDYIRKAETGAVANPGRQGVS